MRVLQSENILARRYFHPLVSDMPGYRDLASAQAPLPVAPLRSDRRQMTSSTLTAPAGRALIAGLFLFSGIGKLAAPDATIGYIAAAGLPFPTLAYAGAVAVEVIGAALLLIGYRVQLLAARRAVLPSPACRPSCSGASSA